MNAPLSPKQIEYWQLARLKPYSRNAKTHNPDQVVKIAASMAEFGWTVPVLVAPDGELIAGHGRILAAAHLGLTKAPVIVLGHLTEAPTTSRFEQLACGLLARIVFFILLLRTPFLR